MDLSAQSTAFASEKYAPVPFPGGDFDSMPLDGPRLRIHRLGRCDRARAEPREVHRSGGFRPCARGPVRSGIQNPFVCSSASQARARTQRTFALRMKLEAAKKLLRRDLRILQVTSIFPGGDRGILKP